MMSDEISKEQYRTAKRAIEAYHGRSIDLNRPEEAHALYFAIDMLEAAEQNDLIEGNRPMRFSDEQKMIELSRNRREEGYAEATLLHEVTSDYEQPKRLSEKLSDLIKKFREFISFS